MRYKMILIVFLIAAALILCGCSQHNPEKVILDYLEDKYEESFVIKSSYTGDGGTYAWVTPEDMESMVFRAEMTHDELHFYDNYPSVLVSGEISEKVRALLAPDSSDLFICTETSLEYVNDSDKDTTPDQHLEENPSDRFYIYILAEEGDMELADLEEKAGSIKDKLGFDRCTIRLSVMPAYYLESIKARWEEKGTFSADDAQASLSTDGEYAEIALDGATEEIEIDEEDLVE